jgi:hypothetical protein
MHIAFFLSFSFFFSKIKNDGYESEINSTLPFAKESL